MVDEVAGGVVRAIGAVLHFLLGILRDALVELVQHLFGRIIGGFFEMVGHFLQITVRALDLLYRLLFRPRRPVEDRTALLHAAAICIIMALGFSAGAIASTFYHTDWNASSTVASAAVER
ncbi:hypothetical protein [Dongia sedimenti]|uniref:Uncharacterized protein n=1 Tax=Dongia sedimenti TaxID=3064282 RepID=A0ABU0YLF3_9PROT|nr:hypothetical protein [Rhodospirillaceae bacterium R-7]